MKVSQNLEKVKMCIVNNYYVRGLTCAHILFYHIVRKYYGLFVHYYIIILNHCMKHSSRTVQIVVVQLLLRHVVLLQDNY